MCYLVILLSLADWAPRLRGHPQIASQSPLHLTKPAVLHLALNLDFCYLTAAATAVATAAHATPFALALTAALDVGSGDGPILGVLPAHLLQLQELDGAHGAVQPYSGFQPKAHAQGKAKCQDADMSICREMEDKGRMQSKDALTCLDAKIIQ